VYIEVWPPYREFLDLHRLIVAAQDFGKHKPVIIAAYIDPLRVDNWRLADAIIFASGAYHLELGEPAAMLADPYFPKFGILDKEAQAVIRRYYDFLVRYEEVLALGTTDATGERAGALRIAGLETGGTLSLNRVAPLVRRGQDFETFSLINLQGVSSGLWDARLDRGPDALDHLSVTIHTDRPVTRAWWASPDQADIVPRALDIQTGKDEDGAYLHFDLPHLAYWDMIVLEYQP
jgi:dextranase